MRTLFLDPVDVLFLRGNKLFGDPGSFGEALMPPWPSVAAGAIRSRMLADAGIDMVAFAGGEDCHHELGTPSEPGSFTLTGFHLARRSAGGRIEILVAPPADLVITREDERLNVKSLQPVELHDAVHLSRRLPKVAVLAERVRSKPESGYWLSEAGWSEYLAGKPPDPSNLVPLNELWAFDLRVGVGLDPETRHAVEGRLFSVQAVALREGVGFLVTVSGADPPLAGTVRFGGDGRAAAIRPVDHRPPEPNFKTIAEQGQCRLVLTTPGLFTSGWLPTGAQPGVLREEDAAVRFDLHGVKGWIVCAAAPRFEVISGWDLARWQPKPAQRVAPQGTVYWLKLDRDVDAEALRALAQVGLWSNPCEDPARRAEGFNRFTLAVWA